MRKVRRNTNEVTKQLIEETIKNKNIKIKIKLQ